MNDAMPEPKRCTVCGDPLRPDNTFGICTNKAKQDCVNARRREARRRNPEAYAPRPRTKQCEICGKPLNANNRSGLCSGRDSAPCLARRNKLANEARLPAGYQRRQCEICGARIKQDNRTGICGSSAKPACKREHRRRLRELAGVKRKRVTVTAGDVFGKWTVLEDRSGNSMVPVRCGCVSGTERDILIYNLTRGISRSCGCLLKEAAARRFPDPYIAARTVFGRLTVLEDVARSTDPARCLCECEGTEVLIKTSPSLKSGGIRSCGCLRREMMTTHGLSKHPLYKEWCNMIQRCTNPKADSYPKYGGRKIKPIKVCDRWMDPAAFIEDIEREIGPRPAGRTPAGMPLYTLDRLDPDGDYEPGRVKWSTQSEQGRNRRKVDVVTEQRDAALAEIERLTGLLSSRSRKPPACPGQDALF